MLCKDKETISLETLAEMLGNLSEQDRQRVIALAELATDAPDKHRDSHEDMPRCPHCSGVHVRRNGFVRGRQRYLCGDCGRTFGATTGSVRYKSKHGKETWEAYLEAFALRLPLREAARKCGIALSTSFFWRHKILDALATGSTGNLLSGRVQEDETYIQDNYKGNCDAENNLGTRGKRHRSPAYKTHRVTGHRHERGKATHTRGLSNQKVCVPCAIDEQGKTLAKAAGRGMVQPRYLSFVLASHLGDDVVMVTDKSRASREFCASDGLPVVQLKAGIQGCPVRGRYNLQKVNSLHSRLRGLLAGFRGVSTKYLDNYLAWNGFEVENPGSNRLDLKTVLLDKMRTIGTCSTYWGIFHKPPLPFPTVG
jgi:transposase-like protein